MKKIRKWFSTLLAGVISSVMLTTAASAETVDVFKGQYGDWFAFFNNVYILTDTACERLNGYDVDFSATVKNTGKNSSAVRAEPFSCNYSYFTVFNSALGVNGSDGNRLMNVSLSNGPKLSSEASTTIAVKTGESVDFVPYLCVERDGIPQEYKDGREYMMLSELSYLPFIHKCSSNNVLVMDDYSYDFIEVSSSAPGVLTVESLNQSNSELRLHANKPGNASLKLTCNYQYKYRDYDVHTSDTDAYYKALFPSLYESTYRMYDNDYYCAFRYELIYNFVVYPTVQKADVLFDDTSVTNITGIFSDCDFTVAANEPMKFSAFIEGHPYSPAFAENQVNITSSTAYIPKTSDNRQMKFVSTATKIYDIDLCGNKKRIKVISGLGNYSSFRARYETSLNAYLKENLCVIKTGDSDCILSFLSDAMNDVAGQNGIYGLPLFPERVRPVIDSYDKTYLSAGEYDILKALKETDGTEVLVGIGESILKVTVSTVNTPSELYIVPTAAVADFNELRRMSAEQISEIAVTDGYTIYQETAFDVYVFSYPRFNTAVSAEISYGSSVASIEEVAGVPHGYRIRTAKTENSFTVKAVGKDDLSKLFKFKVVYIDSIELDPPSIEITYDMMSGIKTGFEGINSFDDIDAAFESAMSSASLSEMAFDKSKNKTLELYVNGRKYLGDIYFVVERDTNGCIEFSNCRKYAGTSGIASDVFVSHNGNANVKISYSTGGMSVEDITIHAFLKAPNRSSTLSKMLEEPHASCKITIMPGDKDTELTGKMKFSGNSEGFQYPFSDMLPYYDAYGNVLYYYGCELTARSDIVYVGLFETENVLMTYKQYAYVPFAVKEFNNGTLTLSGGKRVNFASDSTVIAFSANQTGICNPDVGNLYDKNSAINSFGINELVSDDPDSTGYTFYVWIKQSLPYTVSGTSIKACTLEYTGGKAVYIGSDGKRYSSNDVRFAVIEGDEAINIEGFAENDGKVYIYGTTSANANRKVEYIGQRILIAVSEDMKIVCPECQFPTVVSNDESIATGAVASHNSFRYEQEHADFSVDITGEDDGKETVITVYGNCNSSCEIKVFVTDEPEQDESDDSMITKHYTLNGELGGSEYYFDYTLTVPRSIKVKSGENVSIPITVTITGKDPLRSGDIEPYDSIDITFDDTARSMLNVLRSGRNISVSGKKKGKTGFTVWGYDKHIHIDVEVSVE